MKKSLLLLSLLVASFFPSRSQSVKDTIALVKEFNKVLSFSVQPYLYYATSTVIRSNPATESLDSVRTEGQYYKNNTDLYYGNDIEEAYLIDSLLIRINHERKTVFLNKVDIKSKEKMNLLPLENKEMQQLFKQKYIIKKEVEDSGKMKLNLEAKTAVDSASAYSTTIVLKYDKDFLPELLEMRVKIQQLVDEQMVEELKSKGVNLSNLIQTIGGEQYAVKEQYAAIVFKNISTDKKKAMQMPDWRDRLEYVASEQNFIGKGKCLDYEIVKSF